MSGVGWPVTLSDMLLALGILLLLLEVIKGARPGAKYLTDHLLSLIVFGGAAAEFLLWPRFGTSTYFLLALLALVDFLSGIALRARRGAPVAAGAAASRRAVGNPCPGPEPVPVPAPQPAPAPALVDAAAASVAESVLRDHREPKPSPSRREVVSHAPSPEVPSPGLQPGNGASAVAGRAAALTLRLDTIEQFNRLAASGCRRPVHPCWFALVGGLGVAGSRPAQAAGLRHVLGGRDQMRDEESARGNSRPGICDHCTAWTTGTSATQAGFASHGDAVIRGRALVGRSLAWQIRF